MTSIFSRNDVILSQNRAVEQGPKTVKDEFTKMLQEANEADNADRQAQNRGKKEAGGREEWRMRGEHVLLVKELSEVQKNLLESMDGSDTGIEAVKNARRRRDRDDGPPSRAEAKRNLQMELLLIMRTVSQDSRRNVDLREAILNMARQQLRHIPEPGRSARLKPLEQSLAKLTNGQLQQLFEKLRYGETGIAALLIPGKLEEILETTESESSPLIPATAKTEQIEATSNALKSRIEGLILDGRAHLEGTVLTQGQGLILDEKSRAQAAIVKIDSDSDTPQFLLAALPKHMENQSLPKRESSRLIKGAEFLDRIDQFNDFRQIRVNGRRTLIARDLNNPGQYFSLEADPAKQGRFRVKQSLALVDGTLMPVIKQDGNLMMLRPGGLKIPLIAVSDLKPGGLQEYAAGVRQGDSLLEVTPKSGHVLWELKRPPEDDGKILRLPTPLRGSRTEILKSPVERLTERLHGKAPDLQEILSNPASPITMSKAEYAGTYDILSTEDSRLTSIHSDRARLERRMNSNDLDFHPSDIIPPSGLSNTGMPSLLEESEKIQGLSSDEVRKIRHDIWQQRQMAG